MNLRKALPLLLLLAAVLFGANQYRRYRVAPTFAFQELALTDLEGNRVSLDRYRGKTVFLHFWATWCGPCRAEMPNFEEAVRELQDDDVVFLTVSDESPEKIRRFSEKGYSMEFLKLNGKLRDFDILTVPTDYVIGKEGAVIYTKVNGIDWKDPKSLQKFRDLIAG